MARKFTKYPSNYVKASTGSGKRLGYGVEYRNMHTAIHGILWSADKKVANEIAEICEGLATNEDEEMYESYMCDLESYLFSDKVFSIDEINYRDVTKDQKYYLNDGYIQIINPIAYDLYF